MSPQDIRTLQVSTVTRRVSSAKGFMKGSDPFTPPFTERLMEQVIALIAHLRSKNVNGPFLVAAPLATLPNWVKEFKKWLPSAEVLLYHGTKKDR